MSATKMPIRVSSIWEEHSYFHREACSCGGEFLFHKALMVEFSDAAKIEELTVRCSDCEAEQSALFDISQIYDRRALDPLRGAWPVPSGAGYPMAEQGLPIVDDKGAYRAFDIIGRWQIIGKREGSMGAVYLCADRRNPTRLAVCKYPLNDADVSYHLREIEFYRAFSWTSGMYSAHVIDLLDVQSTKVGPPLLVLEAVHPGPNDCITAADWVKAGMVTPELAGSWTAHVATALTHCRALVPGFVHGDIKADNLLIASGWICKLGDFGLSGAEGVNATPGAPFYRAPELWTPGTVPTVASDVYSLGCLAYELFAGHPPYHIAEHDPGALQHAHQNETPRPSTVVPDIIFRLLSKSPDSRPSLTDIVQAFPHVSTRAHLRRTGSREGDLVNWAAASIAAGDPVTALEVLSSDMVGKSLAAEANRATALSQTGQFEEADRLFEILRTSGDLQVRSNMAAHLHRSGQLERALAEAEAIIAEDPRALEARVTASVVLNDLGKHKHAMEHLETAKDIDPAHPVVLYQLTYTALKLGRCSHAKRYFRRLTERVSRNPQIDALEDLAQRTCPGLFPRTNVA